MISYVLVARSPSGVDNVDLRGDQLQDRRVPRLRARSRRRHLGRTSERMAPDRGEPSAAVPVPAARLLRPQSNADQRRRRRPPRAAVTAAIPWAGDSAPTRRAGADAPGYSRLGTLFRSASHAAALASDGARQSPRGESEPPEPTFGRVRRGAALELAGRKKRSRNTPSHLRISRQPVLALPGVPGEEGDLRRRVAEAQQVVEVEILQLVGPDRGLRCSGRRAPARARSRSRARGAARASRRRRTRRTRPPSRSGTGSASSARSALTL